MQQLMSEQDFCRKAIIETSEILRELTHMQYVCKSFIFQSIKLNEYLFL